MRRTAWAHCDHSRCRRPTSVSVRLTEATVVAADRRLDQARTAVARRRVSTRNLPKLGCARQSGTGAAARRRAPARLAAPARRVTRDRIAHERPQLVVMSFRARRPASTMPTIAASTGASFLPSASPAARPSSTAITSSPRPAPTESIASSDVPRLRARAASPAAGSAASRPRTAAASASTRLHRPRARESPRPAGRAGLDRRPVIDDADDAGVRRHFGGMEREARFFAAHEEHALADACADRIDGDERPAGVRAVGVSG